MQKNIGIVAVVAIVAFGGGVFYGKYSTGTTLADLKNMSNQDRRTALSDAGINFGGGMNGGNGRRSNVGASGDQFISGEVLSIDAKSITLKLQDGGSKIIYTSADTKISKSVPGASNDIKQQMQIVISGSANESGDVTAKTIQIRPAK